VRRSTKLQCFSSEKTRQIDAFLMDAPDRMRPTSTDLKNGKAGVTVHLTATFNHQKIV
jgi:hypothetical protein